MKLFIGIPTTGKIRYELVMWLVRQPNTTLYISVDSSKDTNANKIITKFLQSDCTHLLLIDDDIKPDDGLIERLHGYDKDIVAGCPVIFNRFEKRFKIAAFRKNGKKFENLGITKKLEKVDIIGGGCVLIKRHVLEKINPPWFKIEISDDGINRKGADHYFSEKCTQNGFEVYADCTIALGQENNQELLDMIGVIDNEVERRIRKSKGKRN